MSISGCESLMRCVQHPREDQLIKIQNFSASFASPFNRSNENNLASFACPRRMFLEFSLNQPALDAEPRTLS